MRRVGDIVKSISAVGVLAVGWLGAGAADSASARSAASPKRFTQQMASAGIATYHLGAAKPLVEVKGRRSPVRLTTEMARTAALGVQSGTGLTAGHLNRLTGPARIGPVKVAPGALVVAWAMTAKTPSARLAREYLGAIDSTAYQSVVLPTAVLTLFASDMAVHVPVRAQAGRSSIARSASSPRASAAASGPCTGTQQFIEDAVKRVFDRIGHLKPDPAVLNSVFGSFFGPILSKAGELLVIPVNATIDAARNIVIGAVRVPLRTVTEALAGVSAAVHLASQMTYWVAPWHGRVTAGPNPTSKGVGAGRPGQAQIAVTAPGSSLKWPAWLRNCADLLEFKLPSTTPRERPVAWNLVDQAPGGLVTPVSGNGRLDDNGIDTFEYTTGVEDPETAKGTAREGQVAVVATVQRDDLDRMLAELTDTLLRPIPEYLRSLLDAPLRASLKPMVDQIKRKFLEVRNVSGRDQLSVVYHDPPARPKPPIPPKPPAPPRATGKVVVLDLRLPAVLEVGTFTEATCSVGPGGSPFRLHASNGSSVLNVIINAWQGFGPDYTWRRGTAEAALVTLDGPLGYHDSVFFPPPRDGSPPSPPSGLYFKTAPPGRLEFWFMLLIRPALDAEGLLTGELVQVGGHFDCPVPLPPGPALGLPWP